MRIRPNSLGLNSFLTDFWSLSIKSSPLRSTISSLSSSVVLALISLSSSSLFAIMTTDEEEEGLRNDGLLGVRIRIPLKEDLGNVEVVLGGILRLEGEAMERLNISVILPLSSLCVLCSNQWKMWIRILFSLFYLFSFSLFLIFFTFGNWVGNLGIRHLVLPSQ